MLNTQLFSLYWGRPIFKFVHWIYGCQKAHVVKSHTIQIHKKLYESSPVSFNKLEDFKENDFAIPRVYTLMFISFYLFCFVK